MSDVVIDGVTSVEHGLCAASSSDASFVAAPVTPSAAPSFLSDWAAAMAATTAAAAFSCFSCKQREAGKLGSWEAGKLGSWEAGKLGSWEAEKRAGGGGGGGVRINGHHDVISASMPLDITFDSQTAVQTQSKKRHTSHSS